MAGELKPGDKVIVSGIPYSSDTRKATVMSQEYPKFGGGKVVAVKWGLFGIFKKIVPTNNIVKVRSSKVKLSKAAIATGIVLFVLFLIGAWGMANYTSLVQGRNEVRNSRAKIDTQLERRYELIDNVVQSVKGSQAQESDVFGKIAEARKIGGGTSSPEQQAQANATIDQQIALLPRLQEAYPELKSNDQVTRLIQELQGTANGLNVARDGYNNVVTKYNNKVATPPASIVASMFNFNEEQLFKASNEARINPKVDLKR